MIKLPENRWFQQLCEVLRLGAVLFLVVGGVQCANRMPPPGGPPDRTPPTIVETYPQNGSTQFRGTFLRLRFDQYVDERSVEESIFISPYVGQLEFDWSGKEVEILFSQPLKPHTTYVVNIGTDVTGYYTKTQMTQAYTLAFSTDSVIDRGSLSGRILPRREKDTRSGVMIFAYRLKNFQSDTLTPALHAPDFITQTGKNGNFSFVHLPWGRYRLYALRDEYRNLLYDPEVDDIGVCSQDYLLSERDSAITGIVIPLTREDTTAPRLTKIVPVHRSQVEATFSESLLPASLRQSTISIVDTVTGKELEVKNLFPKTSQPSVIIINTSEQDSLAVYRLRVEGVYDSAGNRINPLANTMLFSGSAKRDTLPFKLTSVSLKDSTDNVSLLPTVTFRFSDAVDTSISHTWVELWADSLVSLPLAVEWQTLTTALISPQKELESLRWYTLRAHVWKIHRWDGKRLADSLRQWKFQTLDAYEFGSIRGGVESSSLARTGVPFFVVALPGETSTQQYTTAVDRTGVFVFPAVIAGRYTLRVFADRNNNGKYDCGKPFPFVPSEPLMVYDDTLRVRSRWPLEGVKLNVPF